MDIKTLGEYLSGDFGTIVGKRFAINGDCSYEVENIWGDCKTKHIIGAFGVDDCGRRYKVSQKVGRGIFIRLDLFN